MAGPSRGYVMKEQVIVVLLGSIDEAYFVCRVKGSGHRGVMVVVFLRFVYGMPQGMAGSSYPLVVWYLVMWI